MVFPWLSKGLPSQTTATFGAGEAFAAAEAYAERCKRLAMPVEPSIAVWLRLGGGSLQATELVDHPTE